MSIDKFVYYFGGGSADGKSVMKDLLGGKGANLAEMTNLGIPVPPGFTISTAVCETYYENLHFLNIFSILDHFVCIVHQKQLDQTGQSTVCINSTIVLLISYSNPDQKSLSSLVWKLTIYNLSSQSSKKIHPKSVCPFFPPFIFGGFLGITT